MAIGNIQVISIGLPNESTGSDSLYTAFTKTNVNFATLFGNASPYNTFNAGNGIAVTSDANTGTIGITNTGVTSITAGTGIVINQSNGNVTISSTGGNGNGGGTLTSVGLLPASNARLTVTGSPLVADGNMSIDLAISGVTAGTYTNPNVSIDAYGRIISASNGATSGTVTSVGITPGAGIQINGGPITSSGNITVTNTGVTRINAGSGISVSSGNGNVTISTTTLGGTVTSVGVASSQLVVTGSPIVGAGTININLPSSITITNSITTSNVTANGSVYFNGSEDLASGNSVNLAVTATYFSTSLSETATLAAGTDGQIKTFMMKAYTGAMVITVTNAGWGGGGTMSFTAAGQGCTLQYISNKWFCIGNNGVTFA
jgi:hypothetical protein